MAMVRRPLVDELAVARRPRQQHPSRAAAERLAHGHELRSPALERAEIPRQRLAQRSSRLALLAKAIEKQLVQNHRIHRDELLTLDTIDEKACGFRVIELGELFSIRLRRLTAPT